MEQPINSKSIKALIAVTSVAIPVVVAILFMVRIPNVAPLSFLPPIYAGINAITAWFWSWLFGRSNEEIGSYTNV